MPKINAGYMLSPANIEALLRDPNSVLSRLYQQCRYAVALELFKVYIAALCEVTNMGNQLAEKHISDDETHTSSKPNTPTTYTSVDASSTDPRPKTSATDHLSVAQRHTLATLTIQMTDLLAKNQSTMNAEQLTAHHQAITSNFISQVAVQLGPKITLDNDLTLAVPQPTLVEPVVANAQKSPLLAPLAPAFAKATQLLPLTPSVLEVLEHNPALQGDVLADDKSRTAFAITHTQFELGPLAVFRMYHAILEVNKITELDNLNRKALMRMIDTTIHATRDRHPTLMQALVDNVQFSLKAYTPKLHNTMGIKSTP